MSDHSLHLRQHGLGQLSQLPDHILNMVLLKLGCVRDLARLACTSRVLRVYTCEEPVWQQLCLMMNGGLDQRLVFKANWRQTALRMLAEQASSQAATAKLQDPTTAHTSSSDEVPSHQHTSGSQCTAHMPGQSKHSVPTEYSITAAATPPPPVPIASEFLYRRWLRCHMQLATFVPIEQQVPRVACDASLTPARFHELYDATCTPVLLTEAMQDWRKDVDWSFQGLVQRCGDTVFSVSKPGAALGRGLMRMADYLDYAVRQADEEPLYVFDHTFGEAAPQLLPPAYKIPSVFDKDYFNVLGDNRPPYRWLVAGPARCGASWHVDPSLTSAWNALCCGRKRWALYPPGVIPPGVTLIETEPGTLVPDDALTSLQWYLEVYPCLPPEQRPIEMVQEPGEVVFVPGGWWHMVLNLEDSVAVTQNLVSRANLERVICYMGWGSSHYYNHPTCYYPAHQLEGWQKLMASANRTLDTKAPSMGLDSAASSSSWEEVSKQGTEGVSEQDAQAGGHAAVDSDDDDDESDLEDDTYEQLGVWPADGSVGSMDPPDSAKDGVQHMHSSMLTCRKAVVQLGHTVGANAGSGDHIANSQMAGGQVSYGVHAGFMAQGSSVDTAAGDSELGTVAQQGAAIDAAVGDNKSGDNESGDDESGTVAQQGAAQDPSAGLPVPLLQRDRKLCLWLRQLLVQHPELRAQVQAAMQAHIGLTWWQAAFAAIQEASAADCALTFSATERHVESVSTGQEKQNSFGATLAQEPAACDSSDSNIQLQHTGAAHRGPSDTRCCTALVESSLQKGEARETVLLHQEAQAAGPINPRGSKHQAARSNQGDTGDSKLCWGGQLESVLAYVGADSLVFPQPGGVVVKLVSEQAKPIAGLMCTLEVCIPRMLQLHSTTPSPGDSHLGNNQQDAASTTSSSLAPLHAAIISHGVLEVQCPLTLKAPTTTPPTPAEGAVPRTEQCTAVAPEPSGPGFRRELYPYVVLEDISASPSSPPTHQPTSTDSTAAVGSKAPGNAASTASTELAGAANGTDADRTTGVSSSTKGWRQLLKAWPADEAQRVALAHHLGCMLADLHKHGHAASQLRLSGTTSSASTTKEVSDTPSGSKGSTPLDTSPVASVLDWQRVVAHQTWWHDRSGNAWTSEYGQIVEDGELRLGTGSTGSTAQATGIDNTTNAITCSVMPNGSQQHAFPHVGATNAPCTSTGDSCPPAGSHTSSISGSTILPAPGSGCSLDFAWMPFVSFLRHRRTEALSDLQAVGGVADTVLEQVEHFLPADPALLLGSPANNSHDRLPPPTLLHADLTINNTWVRPRTSSSSSRPTTISGTAAQSRDHQSQSKQSMVGVGSGAASASDIGTQPEHLPSTSSVSTEPSAAAARTPSGESATAPQQFLLVDFADAGFGDPLYDFLALHSSVFRFNTSLLAACWEAYKQQMGKQVFEAMWPSRCSAASSSSSTMLSTHGAHGAASTGSSTVAGAVQGSAHAMASVSAAADERHLCIAPGQQQQPMPLSYVAMCYSLLHEEDLMLSLMWKTHGKGLQHTSSVDVPPSPMHGSSSGLAASVAAADLWQLSRAVWGELDK